MTAAAFGAAAVTQLVITAAPAAAHAAVATEGAGRFRSGSLAAAFAVTVLATGGAFVRRPSPGRMRNALMRVAMVACLAFLPGTGLADWAATTVAVVGVALIFAPRDPRLPILAVAILATIAGGAAGDVAIANRVFDALHVGAAALWVGSILEIAIAWRCHADEGRRAATEFTRPGVTLFALVVLTGARATAAHLGDATLALGTAWGRALALKLALVLGAVALGLLVRRAWAPRFETAALATVVVLGLLLSASSSPVPDLAAPGPLVERVPGGVVVVAPFAPGPNTVVFSPTTERARPPALRLDGRRVVWDTARDAVGAFASVDLAAGRHRLSLGDRTKTIGVGGDAPSVVISTTFPGGAASDDCLQQLVGATLATTALTNAGRPTRLAVSIGTGCNIGDGALVDKPIEWDAALDVASKTFPEATQVRASRQRARDEIARSLEADRAVVLAPWLLDSDLLTRLTADGQSVLVAARRDPTDALAVDYRSAALAARLPATAGGLEGFVACLSAVAGEPATPAVPAVYTVARVGILPGSLGGDHVMSGWAPGLAVVRVTR